MKLIEDSDLWPDGPLGIIALVLMLVLVAAMHWPDHTTRRWLLRQQWDHRDRLPWRRWRLVLALLRRGVYVRQPLEGNVLYLLSTGRITFGPRVALEAGVRIWGGPDATVSIGAGVELRRNVAIGAIQRVEIGDHTLIAQGSYITDANHVFDDPDVPLSAQGMRVKGPTVIEENVWIGANSVITSGVRVGRGSVIGANTVVTHDVPPRSIVHGPAGVARPARPAGSGGVSVSRSRHPSPKWGKAPSGSGRTGPASPHSV